MTTAEVDSAILAQILARLRKHEDAYPFLKPVDWKRLDLHDYPEIVAHPMDLQTVGRRLRDGQYGEPLVRQFTNDLQLIWNNCRLYNDEKTEIYAMADRMESYMTELIKEMLPTEVHDSLQLDSNTQRTAGSASQSGQTAAESRHKRRRTTTTTAGGGAGGRRGSDDESLADPSATVTPPLRKKKSGRGPGRPKKSAGRGSEQAPGDQPPEYEMTDESNERVIPPQMTATEETSEERKALINKFTNLCRSLNRVQIAQVLCMVWQEMEKNVLPADVLSAPQTSTRGRRPASQVCVLNLDLLADQQLRRICSVMKVFAKFDQPRSAVVAPSNPIVE
eukprot:Protomagalhaensia_sp_Gyna_25__4469@NODE_409_length_3527_cov_145_545298_g315_i0_p2_GENE_NODE_409_length_3527_cov_145_545298_g315_i0NODE_409_length_3527_cov_145_545298_g315_i0_p2_ORF_typecomplete_len335_score60_77Bromodomain/PF00439_25/4e25_NODE_409_length_3527_cov_145_545298_g315_i014502454